MQSHFNTIFTIVLNKSHSLQYDIMSLAVEAYPEILLNIVLLVLGTGGGWWVAVKS